MAEEANVKIRLDGKPAKAELRDLNRMAEGTATKISGGMGGRSFGMGLIGAGVGALAARGMGALKSAGQQAGRAGITDLFSGALSPLGIAATPDLALRTKSRTEALKNLPFDLIGATGGDPEVMRGARVARDHDAELIYRRLKGMQIAGRDPVLTEGTAAGVTNKVIDAAKEIGGAVKEGIKKGAQELGIIDKEGR